MKQALRKSALVGASVGAVLAALLLLNGAFYGWEGLEGSMMLAWFVGFPVSLAFAAVGFGEYAKQWVAFLIMVLPLNGALWGLLVGGALTGVRRRHR